jgi:hypothetical protein
MAPIFPPRNRNGAPQIGVGTAANESSGIESAGIRWRNMGLFSFVPLLRAVSPNTAIVQAYSWGAISDCRFPGTNIAFMFFLIFHGQTLQSELWKTHQSH